MVGHVLISPKVAFPSASISTIFFRFLFLSRQWCLRGLITGQGPNMYCSPFSEPNIHSHSSCLSLPSRSSLSWSFLHVFPSMRRAGQSVTQRSGLDVQSCMPRNRITTFICDFNGPQYPNDARLTSHLESQYAGTLLANE